jgi:hypothetical protein
MSKLNDYDGNEEYIYDSSENDYVSSEYSEDEDFYLEQDRDDIFYEEDINPTRWNKIKIANNTIYVSNKGEVKFSDSIFNCSKGIHIEGTPYRSICIPLSNYDTEIYYIHELVWVAFNDDIPEGWFVGHKDKSSAIYDNSLFNLDLYRTTVRKHFKKFLF